MTETATSSSDARRQPRRPAFGLVIVAAVLFRLGRERIQQVLASHYGPAAGFLVVLLGVGGMVVWRLHQRRRARVRGAEFTAEAVAQQIVDSGLAPAAFAEDGTLFGAGVIVVNQRPKILEVNTEYELFGSGGERLGFVRQVGQSRGKQLARIFTLFDQYFTHQFVIDDANGQTVARLVRPRKVFRTKVVVSDAHGSHVGTIRQRNVFWKIRFALLDASDEVVGHMRAQNLRAWDFTVTDADDRPVGAVVKSWEGWAHTAFTRADRYVVRIDEVLPDPLRTLAVVAALSVDLALKQDTRSIG